MLALALISAAVLAPVAAAQTPPASRPSPDSPAGVEYQLPLERARSEAGVPPSSAPGSTPPSTSGQGDGTARLFGEGIERKRGAGGAKATRADSGAPASQAGEPSAPQRRRVVASVGSGDESDQALMVGIVAAVLAVGAAFGLGLRRALQTR